MPRTERGIAGYGPGRGRHGDNPMGTGSPGSQEV